MILNAWNMKKNLDSSVPNLWYCSHDTIWYRSYLLQLSTAIPCENSGSSSLWRISPSLSFIVLLYQYMAVSAVQNSALDTTSYAMPRIIPLLVPVKAEKKSIAQKHMS